MRAIVFLGIRSYCWLDDNRLRRYDSLSSQPDVPEDRGERRQITHVSYDDQGQKTVISLDFETLWNMQTMPQLQSNALIAATPAFSQLLPEKTVPPSTFIFTSAQNDNGKLVGTEWMLPREVMRFETDEEALCFLQARAKPKTQSLPAPPEGGTDPP